MKEVVITGYGQSILTDSKESLEITRENRKIMRLGRRSAVLYLNALEKAIQMSHIVTVDEDAYRKGVFYADFMNLVMDKAHLFELYTICKKETQGYDSKVFLDAIVKNWSAIEALKEIPNVPAFLAAQMTVSKGMSSTVLGSCSGGLMALKDAYDAIRRGDLDIAFVGGATTKLDLTEALKFNEFQIYQEDDYAIADGAAVLILESKEHLQQRKGISYGRILQVATSFSAEAYLHKRFDEDNFKFLIQDMVKDNITRDIKTRYIPGSFTKKILSDEIRAVSETGDCEIIKSYKEKAVYTFAASGLMEIIEYINEYAGDSDLIVTSLGYGGQNACIKLNIPAKERRVI